MKQEIKDRIIKTVKTKYLKKKNYISNNHSAIQSKSLKQSQFIMKELLMRNRRLVKGRRYRETDGDEYCD